MKTNLDLYDIQGNIVKGYGRFGFPKARYILYRVTASGAGRNFVKDLIPFITTSVKWVSSNSTEEGVPKPKVTTNIAFTYEGLKNLAIPELSLHSFPDEFSMGMKGRVDILGDDGASAPDNWDPVWQLVDQIHILISINGETIEDIEGRYKEIGECLSEGVEQLDGHKGDDGIELPYQDGSAIYDGNTPTPKEHFGYTDGISDPYFRGSGASAINVVGGGKRTREDATTNAGWEPLETGEFLLGHKDESDEYPAAPIPRLMSRNGTFMVFRKLHQNVGLFNAYLEKEGARYSGGAEELAAKFAGRWRNGAPLVDFPTEKSANEFIAQFIQARSNSYTASAESKEAAREEYLALKKKLVAFDFDKDIPGSKCPVGSHIRRANPRGSLEFGKKKAFNTHGALVNRRRIARRGLPYGKVKDPSSNDGNHGIIFMALNASIKRQFEFVQQQWINYGNDFRLANDKDPLIGNHQSKESGEGYGRMVIEADPNGDQPPFFCHAIPRFVETRGGDYFFIPSLTALRLIGAGLVDPT